MIRKSCRGYTTHDVVGTLYKGRSQKVVLHCFTCIEEFACSKGVPQGCVLGPLLFNVYVADLHPMASRYNVSVPSFAEDMTLYCSRTSLKSACSDFSTALITTTISTELDSRGLKLNCGKTLAMLICPRSNGVSKIVAGESSLANITCDGKKIPLVSNTRLLGRIVDSNLSWKDHVSQACLKVNRKIQAILSPTNTHCKASALSLGDTARSRICCLSHRT